MRPYGDVETNLAQTKKESLERARQCNKNNNNNISNQSIRSHLLVELAAVVIQLKWYFSILLETHPRRKAIENGFTRSNHSNSFVISFVLFSYTYMCLCLQSVSVLDFYIYLNLNLNFKKKIIVYFPLNPLA